MASEVCHGSDTAPELKLEGKGHQPKARGQH